MKKGYRFGPASAKAAGMMRVAGCPEVSLRHRGLKYSLRVAASTVKGKRTRCVRSAANSLSGTSFPPSSLAAPLSLPVFGAMANGRG